MNKEFDLNKKNFIGEFSDLNNLVIDKYVLYNKNKNVRIKRKDCKYLCDIRKKIGLRYVLDNINEILGTELYTWETPFYLKDDGEVTCNINLTDGKFVQKVGRVNHFGKLEIDLVKPIFMENDR